MTIACTAPGKLFLSGEYAVLEGAEAVVTAVSRRASAKICSTALSSPIVESIRETVARFFVDENKREITIPALSIKSPSFRIKNRKVGLGSSAAVCAASVGAIFEWAGFPIEKKRAKILEVASDAHRLAQEGKGSGGDVAVAVLGGAIVFSMDGVLDKINMPSVEFVAVWTGYSASTQLLIEQINTFKRKAPDAYRSCFGDLKARGAVLANAYRKGSAKDIIEHTRGYGLAMARLGTEAGVPIVTSEHKLISNLAAEIGGAAKPSGAGGGDVAIAIFEDPDAAKSFKSKCIRFNLIPLNISFQDQGLRREERSFI